MPLRICVRWQRRAVGSRLRRTTKTEWLSCSIRRWPGARLPEFELTRLLEFEFKGLESSLHIRVTLVLVAAALAAVAASAVAAERVSLSNGFEMRCDHHAQVESRVRLYLSKGEDNYIELRPEEIVGVEQVPDPPPQSAPSKSKSQLYAKLSPADLHEMLTEAGHEHNLDVDLLAS